MRARRAGHRRSALARGRAQLTVSAACPAALIHLMKNRALKKCKDEQKAYADCVRGRGISLARARMLASATPPQRASRRATHWPQVWVCRESANAMGACLTCVARRIARAARRR